MTTAALRQSCSELLDLRPVERRPGNREALRNPSPSSPELDVSLLTLKDRTATRVTWLDAPSRGLPVPIPHRSV